MLDTHGGRAVLVRVMGESNAVVLLSTVPSAYFPRYVDLLFKNIAPVTLVSIVATAASCIACIAALAILPFWPGWISVVIICIACPVGAAGGNRWFVYSFSSARERAKFLAWFANGLNDVVAGFFDGGFSETDKESQEGFDKEKQELFKAAVADLAQKPPTSLTQFNKLIDTLFRHAYNQTAGVLLDLLRETMLREGGDSGPRKFVMDCLDRNHCYVRSFKEFQDILAAAATVCRSLPEPEAERLHKITLDILFKKTRYCNNAKRSLEAPANWIVVKCDDDAENEKQLTRIRKVFEIPNFDGVDAQQKLDDLIDFLGRHKPQGRGCMSFEQFRTRFDPAMRYTWMRWLANAPNFEYAYTRLHKLEFAILKEHLSPGALQRRAYGRGILAEEVAKLAQAGDCYANFIGDNAKRGKALVRAVLRYCSKKIAKQLLETLGKLAAPRSGSDASRRNILQQIYTRSVLGRMPCEWREDLARAVGYAEDEIREMGEAWCAGGALSRVK
jgi:hypothetical protein